MYFITIASKILNTPTAFRARALNFIQTGRARLRSQATKIELGSYF